MKPLSGFTNSINPSSSSSSSSYPNMFLKESSDSSSIFSSIWFWLITLLILAFGGFYMYFYLAKGMNTTDIFSQITQYIGNFSTSTSDIISSSITNLPTLPSLSSSGPDTSPTSSPSPSPSPTSPSPTSSSPTSSPSPTNPYQDQGIHSSGPQQIQDRDQTHLGKEPQYQPMQQQMQPSYPTSYAQSNNFPPNNLSEPSAASDGSSAKSGWCYVGEDGGNRSCIESGEFDTCMSGNIFSTRDICINPSLRS